MRLPPFVERLPSPWPWPPSWLMLCCISLFYFWLACLRFSFICCCCRSTLDWQPDIKISLGNFRLIEIYNVVRAGSGVGTECPLWLTLEFNYGLSPGGGLKRVISATYNWKGLKRYARARVLHISYVLSGRRQMSQLPPLPDGRAQAELKIILKNTETNSHTHTYIHKLNSTPKLHEIKRELHVYENPFIYLKIQLNKRGK